MIITGVFLIEMVDMNEKDYINTVISLGIYSSVWASRMAVDGANGDRVFARVVAGGEDGVAAGASNASVEELAGWKSTAIFGKNCELT